jgi:hypothetical protein
MNINKTRTVQRLPTACVLADVTNNSDVINARISTAREVDPPEALSEYEGDNQENECPLSGLDDPRRVRFSRGPNMEKLITPDSSFQVGGKVAKQSCRGDIFCSDLFFS